MGPMWVFFLVIVIFKDSFIKFDILAFNIKPNLKFNILAFNIELNICFYSIRV